MKHFDPGQPPLLLSACQNKTINCLTLFADHSAGHVGCRSIKQTRLGRTSGKHQKVSIVVNNSVNMISYQLISVNVNFWEIWMYLAHYPFTEWWWIRSGMAIGLLVHGLLRLHFHSRFLQT